MSLRALATSARRLCAHVFVEAVAFDPFKDLDKRQRLALRQALQNGSSSAPTKVVKRLEKFGLVVRTGHYHEPTEWDRVVRREPMFYLTPAGEEAAKKVQAGAPPP